MQPLCKPRTVSLFDHEPHRPPVPAKFRPAVQHSGGQGRPPGRRASARLTLDGRERGAIRFGVGTAHQLSPERTPWTL
jgi:hypothetical protein